MAETRKFVELDFHRTRDEIVKYLKSQTEFHDFDFMGSASSVLINALAYTTNQLAVMANMSVSEAFLDSAQLRGPVVSHAKEISYIPRSRSAAYSELMLRLDLGPTKAGFTDLFIPRGTKFSATINGQSFNFVTLDRYQMKDLANNGIYYADIIVHEGILTKQQWRYQAGVVNQILKISNKNIDTEYITVKGRETLGSTNITEYFSSDNIVLLDRNSDAFFVQEGVDGFYEIFFGDNVIGREPPPDSIIEAEYLVTKGTEANGISTFAMIDNVSRNPENQAPEVYPGTAFSIVVSQPAGYGSERESIASIKAAAPKIAKAQNRAVTKEDYVSLIQGDFGFIETMSVWGGQDAVPPQYGKVLISIKPRYGDYLSPLTKERIRERILERYAIIGITPEIVDPDFTYIYVNSDVYFRKEETTLSDGELNNLVRQSVERFFTSNVSFFDESFRYSKFVAAIDETDEAIKGNQTTIQMAKIFKPNPGVLSQFKFEFFNALKPGTVNTDVFMSISGQPTQLRDDGVGNIDLYVNGTLLRKQIGTVDYASGVANLARFAFDVPANTTIVFKTMPLNDDLFTVRNNLIVLRNTAINMVRLGS